MDSFSGELRWDGGWRRRSGRSSGAAETTPDKRGVGFEGPPEVPWGDEEGKVIFPECSAPKYPANNGGGLGTRDWAAQSQA